MIQKEEMKMNRIKFKLTPKGLIALAVLSALLIGAIFLNATLNNKEKQTALNEKPNGGGLEQNVSSGGMLPFPISLKSGKWTAAHIRYGLYS